MQRRMSKRVTRLIGIIIALLSLTEATALAGWRGAVVGRDECATMTIDAAGTTHLVALATYKNFDLVYTTYNRKGVRGPLSQSNVGLMIPLGMAIPTDSKNRPYVALINGDQAKFPSVIYLEYLVFNGHGWDSQVIDNTVDDTAYDVQVILDANDRPHLFYLRANGLLTHAYFDGSAWHFESVGVPVAPTA